MQKNNPEDYPLFFTDPQGCSPSECLTFVGIERNEGNPDYLNFYLEGATTTWVAVGFSDTPNMVSMGSTVKPPNETHCLGDPAFCPLRIIGGSTVITGPI